MTVSYFSTIETPRLLIILFSEIYLYPLYNSDEITEPPILNYARTSENDIGPFEASAKCHDIGPFKVKNPEEEKKSTAHVSDVRNLCLVLCPL